MKTFYTQLVDIWIQQNYGISFSRPSKIIRKLINDYMKNLLDIYTELRIVIINEV